MIKAAWARYAHFTLRKFLERIALLIAQINN
jgi:hypothetical protein